MELVETLHGLCSLLDQSGNADPKTLLADAATAFEFVLGLDWPDGEFGGREVLLSRLAFLCWRNAREAEDPAAEFHWIRVHASINEAASRSTAEKSLAPLTSEAAEEREPGLEDLEQLLAIFELLRQLVENEPARAKEKAELLHLSLRNQVWTTLSADERNYCRGELALIAGGACRVLARRDEARRWFDLSEASFKQSHNASAHIARVAYQRLALKAEERAFDSVLELAPLLVERFLQLGLTDDAIKSRFLEAHALKETERLEEAKLRFREIKRDTRSRGLDRLAAIAAENLFQINAFLNQPDEAIAEAEEAVSILVRQPNRVNLAKLQIGVGFLFRGQAKLNDSINAFREAQRQFKALQMEADVASVHLILADLFLDEGQVGQAEFEIQAAIPVIENLKLLPEGIAAVSLLRDSLRRRQIDRQALRDLRRHFSNPKE